MIDFHGERSLSWNSDTSRLTFDDCFTSHYPMMPGGEHAESIRDVSPTGKTVYCRRKRSVSQADCRHVVCGAPMRLTSYLLEVLDSSPILRCHHDRLSSCQPQRGLFRTTISRFTSRPDERYNESYNKSEIWTERLLPGELAFPGCLI